MWGTDTNQIQLLSVRSEAVLA